MISVITITHKCITQKKKYKTSIVTKLLILVTSIYFLQHYIIKENYAKVRKKIRGEESVRMFFSVIEEHFLELFYSLGKVTCV